MTEVTEAVDLSNILNNEQQIESDIDNDRDDKSETTCVSIISTITALFRRLGRSQHHQTRNSDTKNIFQGSSGSESTPIKCKSARHKSKKSNSYTDMKVKNIYRRPVSRTGVRPRASSYSQYQSQSVNNYLFHTNNRSRDWNSHGSSDTSFGRPRDLLDRDSDPDWSDQEYSDVGSWNSVTTSDYENIHLPDCYRPRACTMPPLPHSLLRHRQAHLESRILAREEIPIRSGSARNRRDKRTCFKNNVDICYFSKGDEPDEIITPSKPSITNHNYKNVDTIIEDQAKPYLPYISDDNTCNICDIDAKIIQSIDPHGDKAHCLRLTVGTRGNFIKDKTLVTSLNGGGSLLVCLVPDNHGIACSSATVSPVKKRLKLPVSIDPNSVKISSQKEGILVIIARLTRQK